MVTARVPENDFEKAPAGVHLARCIRLIDLGHQLNKKFGKSQHKIRIYWELPNALMKSGEFAGKPFVVTRLYTLSLSEKSDLRTDLKSWRGREFTPQELAGFDLNNIVDKCCLLNIVHNDDFANIAAIMPVLQGTPIPERVNDLIIFDLNKFDPDVLAKLSPNIQETIKQSPEYKTLENAMNNMNNEQQHASYNLPENTGIPRDFNDDIPF